MKNLLSGLALMMLFAGLRAQVLEAFHANMPAVHAEKGCIEYGPTVDADGAPAIQTALGPDTFVVVEKWATMDDLKAHGAAPHMAAGATVIDFSTIGTAAARRLHEALAERGLSFLDAPVTGGVVAAESGRLVIMVGGDAAAFARAWPGSRAPGIAAVTPSCMRIQRSASCAIDAPCGTSGRIASTNARPVS